MCDRGVCVHCAGSTTWMHAKGRVNECADGRHRGCQSHRRYCCRDGNSRTGSWGSAVCAVYWMPEQCAGLSRALHIGQMKRNPATRLPGKDKIPRRGREEYPRITVDYLIESRDVALCAFLEISADEYVVLRRKSGMETREAFIDAITEYGKSSRIPVKIYA